VRDLGFRLPVLSPVRICENEFTKNDDCGRVTRQLLLTSDLMLTSDLKLK